MLAISIKAAVAAEPHVHYKSVWNAANVVVRLEEGIQLSTDTQVGANSSGERNAVQASPSAFLIGDQTRGHICMCKMRLH
jgi:hypothetical protein